ncbi:APC family permease [Lutispora sp.]|uniref:APC family permease n=1 Tax=Lutispora sp. TaxID=2828727 RepID=UPI002B206F63|nr:APC family permease [Lutispora sp.]MEA4960597.1 APC family permease [Lutispora sp.]
MEEQTTQKNASGGHMTSTKELKRVLDRKDLLSIAIGQTIGSGVFALVGVGIGMTGRSVSVAMLIAAVFTIMMDIPMMLVSGTVRLRGGFYTQLAFLQHKKAAGFYVIVHIISWTALAMYAISVSQYLLDLIGRSTINPELVSIIGKLIAFAVLTIFYVANLFGIQGAAKLQNAMMVCMTLGLTAFIVFGLPQVSPNYFTEDFLPSGLTGLFAAGALLTWAVGGANVIVHLGAEAKNPTKDIPVIIILATVIIAVFYSLIAVVASGVLPVAEVAGQPLSLVAAKIFPRPIYVFFIVGGAIFALTTTLNASLGWVTKPILQAAVDGWFPPFVAKIGKRYKAPVTILTILYLECLLPIFFGVNVDAIANLAIILTNVCFAMICFSVANVKKVVPDLWEKSRFHVSDRLLKGLSIMGGTVCLLQIGLLVMVGDMNWHMILSNLGALVFALAYTFWRDRNGNVNMEISYEEA